MHKYSFFIWGKKMNYGAHKKFMSFLIKSLMRSFSVGLTTTAWVQALSRDFWQRHLVPVTSVLRCNQDAQRLSLNYGFITSLMAFSYGRTVIVFIFIVTEQINKTFGSSSVNFPPKKFSKDGKISFALKC
jgi:hypothetical protein